MTFVTRFLAVMVCLVAYATAQAQKAEMPAPTAFNVGDSWEWRQVDNRTKLEEAKLARTVVKVDGILQFNYIGTTNYQISAAFIDNSGYGYKHSLKPWRVWPLEVGKKWVFDADWARPDGVTGNTKQDADVVAYEEVVVPAGKFMAFKIEYRGWYRGSWGWGSNGKQNDTFWYAPDANADVKQIRDDGYNMYTRELISYKRGAP